MNHAEHCTMILRLSKNIQCHEKQLPQLFVQCAIADH